MTWRAWRHRAACHDGVERSGAGRARQRGKAGPCAGVVLAAWALGLTAQAHAQTTPNTAALMQQANAGNAPAEYDLGVDYHRGEDGLPQDPAKAAYWYEKSAKQGYARAEFNLGVYYYKGKGGLPQDPAKAVSWFRKAAAQGLKPAIAALQRLQHPPPQVATVTTPPPAPAAVSTPVADNQQALQNLQRFWTLYFQASNAQVVDFGEPALVRPVSFGDAP